MKRSSLDYFCYVVNDVVILCTTAVLMIRTTGTSGFLSEPEKTVLTLQSPENNSLPCLNMTFMAVFTIRFLEEDGSLLQYDENIIPAADIRVNGSCGSNETAVQLSWNNDTIQLLFILQTQIQQQHLQAEINSSAGSLMWSLTEVQMTLLPNNEFNTGTLLQLRTNPKNRFFETPTSQSYSCHQNQLITMKTGQNATDHTSILLDMWDVEIHTYGFGSNLRNQIMYECPEDVQMKGTEEMSIVPFVIAVCLAVIILIILVAYAVTKSRDRLQYSNL